MQSASRCGSGLSWSAIAVALLSFIGGASAVPRKHIRQPMTGAEKQAVGEALSHALGVMSGKEKSGSKFGICLDMFPNGPPKDAATDATWQSCKGVLFSGGAHGSLMEVGRVEHTKQPITGAESQAVGEALSHALGVMSGKEKSGSKLDICMDMFPNGPPRDAATDATWQSCKGVLSGGGGLLMAVKRVEHIKQPISGQEKQAVGEALSHALGVMSGKEKSGSKFGICLDMFPNGPPKDAATDATWQSCKGVLSSGASGSLMAVKRVEYVKQPMTGTEKQAVGEALSHALGVMSGKKKSGSKMDICMRMFPNGPPNDAATDASWQSCKGLLPSGTSGSLLAVKRALRQQRK